MVGEPIAITIWSSCCNCRPLKPTAADLQKFNLTQTGRFGSNDTQAVAPAYFEGGDVGYIGAAVSLPWSRPITCLYAARGLEPADQDLPYEIPEVAVSGEETDR